MCNRPSCPRITYKRVVGACRRSTAIHQFLSDHHNPFPTTSILASYNVQIYLYISAWYLNFVMMLNGLALLATVFVLNQHHKNPSKPVYSYVRKFVLKQFHLAARIHERRVEAEGEDDWAHGHRFLDRKNSEETHNHKDQMLTKNSFTSENFAEEWACLARLLDRFFFFVYVCIVLSGTVAFLVCAQNS